MRLMKAEQNARVKAGSGEYGSTSRETEPNLKAFAPGPLKVRSRQEPETQHGLLLTPNDRYGRCGKCQ